MTCHFLVVSLFLFFSLQGIPRIPHLRPHLRQAQHGSHDPSDMATEGGWSEINRDHLKVQTSSNVRNVPGNEIISWCTMMYNMISGSKPQFWQVLYILSRTIAIYDRISWCIFLFSWFIILSLPVVSCELYWRGWQETAYVKQRKELKRRIEPLNEICTQSCVSNLTSASETKFTCMQICWRQRHQPVEGCIYSHTAVYMINSTPKCRSVYLPRSFPRKRISVNVENVKKKRG